MLNRKKKYLQIALNNTLEEAKSIIFKLPLDERIIIEVGTPLIKTYGLNAIRLIKNWWKARILGEIIDTKPEGFFQILLSSFKAKENPESKNSNLSPYIVADLKCMDRGAREVLIAKQGGANAAVVLGQAPIETINAFILECERQKLDSMIDMMNVEYPIEILRQLKKPPQVVILHRGVDEETFNPEKEIPFHEISKIKENYDIMVAVAGGDTFQEVQRAIFNDADIVVIWKSFYQSTEDTKKIAEKFLKEIK